MTRPEEAARKLRSHFESVEPGEFVEGVKAHDPEFFDERVPLPRRTKPDEERLGEIHLLHSQPTPLPLNAYLASALTGLASEQRQLVFQLSDMVSVVCKSVGIELYEPRKATDPVHHGDVPDTDVFHIDRERVLDSDLVIHLAHFPSTGSGEELDFAYNALVPIVVVSHEETRISRMVTGIPCFKLLLSYREPEELRLLLTEQLLAIRPLLEQRKLAFSETYDVNIVGDRIRRLREGLGLTRDQVVKAAKAAPITIEMLQHIEESTDRQSNPSLVHLREIATTLKTTVADLVEPDISERALATLQEWTQLRTSARFGSAATDNDRKVLLRRFLLRVLYSLDESTNENPTPES